jgi:hypothetical protein
MLAASAPCAEKHPDAVKAFSDPGVITTRQQITPAGVESAFEGPVYGAVFDHDSSLVWVLTSNELLARDWRLNRVVHRVEIHGDPGLPGLRYDEQRRRVLYTSATKSATRKQPTPFWKYRVQATDVQLLSTEGDREKLISSNLGTEVSGAIAVSGRTAAVPLIRDNQIAIADLDGQATVKKIPTSVGPLRCGSQPRWENRVGQQLGRPPGGAQ